MVAQEVARGEDFHVFDALRVPEDQCLALLVAVTAAPAKSETHILPSNVSSTSVQSVTVMTRSASTT